MTETVAVPDQADRGPAVASWLGRFNAALDAQDAAAAAGLDTPVYGLQEVHHLS